MSDIYSKADWLLLKTASADKWRLAANNPLLPREVADAHCAKYLLREEAADNALDLIAKGYSVSDAHHMTIEWLEWKLGEDE